MNLHYSKSLFQVSVVWTIEKPERSAFMSVYIPL